MSDTVVVNEIYATLQGEGARAGRPCVIVRLELGPSMVLVTGGEPLCQSNTPALLLRLCQAGREVLLETNGSMDISIVDERVGRCVDVKCPGSGQTGSFRESNFAALAAGDEVKFVLVDRADYDYAREVIAVRLGLQLHKIIWPERDRGV